MDKLFEGLDEDSNLSVKEMKSRFLAYEAEKKKKEDEVQSQMAQMSAMLKNLTSGTSSGAFVPPESFRVFIIASLAYWKFRDGKPRGGVNRFLQVLILSLQC